MRAHGPAVVVLLVVAFAVRWWLRQGLVLGDDPQEFAVLLHILSFGPLLSDQLHLRFAGWIFNHLAFWLGGVSETMFLLPTALLTSTFSVMAYAILVRWRYGRLRAFLGGLLVALAPFEVVLGSLRANDSYLELALAAGFTGLVLLERRPVWQGIVLALSFWFGFYVKLWVVYVLPALGIYYLVGRRWRATIAFTIASIVVHGATCLYWYSRLGTFFPFISAHAANYPVPWNDLGELFLKYPHLIFVGSFEFPTTLWGATPYVLVALLFFKLLATAVRSAPAALRFDRGDGLLLAFWGSFFFWLNFFPNGFQLDAYYSVPRIFRYLAPISFPIAFHAAKCVLDLSRVAVAGVSPRVVATVVAAPLLALYVSQGVQANGPSSIYHENLHAVLDDVVRLRPPVLLGESVVASYIRDLYLDPDESETQVMILGAEHAARDYEKWLKQHENTLPNGTMLITGMASFVHYGAHIDGFRLAWFEQPLSPQWKLVREYGMLTYLPRPEPARLWRLDRQLAPLPVVLDEREDLRTIKDVKDPAEMLRSGMSRYDASDYAGARVFFRKLRTTKNPLAEDGAFFYAATFFREANWLRARHEFKWMLRHFAQSRWVPSGYWHIASCDKNLGHMRRSRQTFELVVRRFPNDPSTVNLARRDLMTFQNRHEGALARWWRGRRS